jgi:hypothetical protein
MCALLLLSSSVSVQLVGVVVKTFGEAYPELVKHQDSVLAAIR